MYAHKLPSVVRHLLTKSTKLLGSNPSYVVRLGHARVRPVKRNDTLRFFRVIDARKLFKCRATALTIVDPIVLVFTTVYEKVVITHCEVVFGEDMQGTDDKVCSDKVFWPGDGAPLTKL